MNIEILGKTFDDEKINNRSKQYDQKYFEEYQNYLLSIPETEVIKMDIGHAYERIRFISQREQPELLRKTGYNPTPQGKDKVQSRASQGHYKQYKNWTGD